MRLHSTLIAALLAAASVTPALAQLQVTKPANLAAPITMAPGQGALIIGYRRPDGWSLGKSGTVTFARYDPVSHDMIPRPKDAKKLGDTNTYWISASSVNKKLPLEYEVMLVSAGDYVLYGASPGPGGMALNSFCFNSITVRVNAGEAVYFGDFTPYIGAKTADGQYYSGMPLTFNAEEAKTALAKQPALLAGFKAGTLRGGASFTCAGQVMTAYELPDLPRLPPLTAAEKAELARKAGVKVPGQALPNTTTTPILIPTN